MARRSAPPPPAESKTGLIIALVLFIITTLIGGTMAYMGFSGQTEYKNRAGEAQKEAKNAKEERDKMEVRRILNAIYNGSATQADRTNLALLMQTQSGAYNEELGRLNNDYKKYLGEWVPNENKPPMSFADFAAKMVSEVADRDNKLKAAGDDLNKTRNDLQAALAAADSAKDAALAKQKQANDDLVKTQNTQSEAFKDLTNTVAKQREDYTKLMADKEAAEKKLAREILALRASLSEKDKLIQRQKEVIDESREDITRYDVPKGLINQVDRAANLVYINIGSDHNVRPQLTFSVLAADAAGNGAAIKDRKGAIEVVGVLGPNAAVGRIIDVTNPTRDPIVRGDLLFNPAWSPDRRDHIAIAGLIDLNGDGMDDTPDFIRSLERQGVVVDSYIDLKDVSIRGSGMTESTSYLVIGDKPDTELHAFATGAKAERLKLVMEKVTDLKTQADRLGVQKVPYRRFLAMMGYQMPRIFRPAEYAPPGSIKATLGGAPKEGEMPAKKDEKDEGK